MARPSLPIPGPDLILRQVYAPKRSRQTSGVKALTTGTFAQLKTFARGFNRSMYRFNEV